jgi:hypothetical protein
VYPGRVAGRIALLVSVTVLGLAVVHFAYHQARLVESYLAALFL